MRRRDAAQAVALRIATAFDPQTMDPHALALLYHTRVAYQVYDSLVNRDEQFRARAGARAVVAARSTPTTWRFKLRPGVVFHDGTPFTRRRRGVLDASARWRRRRSARFQLKGVTAASKVDEQTLEIQLEAPDAVLPEKLQSTCR